MVVHNLTNINVDEAVQIAGRERIITAFFAETRRRGLTVEDNSKMLTFALEPYINEGSLWVELKDYNDNGDRLVLIEFLQTISDSEFSQVVMKLDAVLQELCNIKGIKYPEHMLF